MSLQFNLELVEEISGPARTAQAHLEKLRASAQAAGKALDFSEQAKRSIEELARIKLDPRGFLAAHEASKKLAEEQKKLIRQHEGFGGGLKSALLGNFGQTFSAVALGEIAGEGLIRLGEGLIELGHKFVEIVVEGVGEAFKAAGQQEHLQNSFRYIFGSAEAAKEALEEADHLSKNLAFGPAKTAGYLGMLGQAGIKGQSATNALALASDIGAMNPNGQGTEEALSALARLKRHGEFSGRLAEALQVNLPDLYAALGKHLHLTTKEAEKKLSQPGAIGFNTILNTMMQLHSDRIGGNTGSAAVDQSQELMARWNKIKELPEEYLRNIANAPGWKRFSETLGRVLDQLSPEKHPEIINGLMEAFNRLADKAASFLTPENIKKFTDALADLPDSLAKVGEGLNTALKIAEALAAVFAGVKLASGLTTAASAAPTVGTAAGVGARVASGAASGLGVTAGTLGIAVAAPFMSSDNAATTDALDKQSEDLVKAGRRIEHKHLFGLLTTYEDAPGNPGTPSAPRNTQINVPQITVNVHTDKDDTAHTTREVGEQVHRAASQALERAAQEAGAN